MAESSLYQQIVLEHYRHPRNRGSLDTCTHAADGANPLCGDRLRIELACAGERIEGLRFSGEACAIAGRFEQLVESGDEDGSLGALNAMRELQHHPSRRKCALLPWATLRAALAGEARATTEMEPA
jgi:nitrogen fixation NifU-like protein